MKQALITWLKDKSLADLDKLAPIQTCWRKRSLKTLSWFGEFSRGFKPVKIMKIPYFRSYKCGKIAHFFGMMTT